MELKWLEDFLSLTETRNFSRSAQTRHVTQPAFSRRIRALEAWVGTDLIDRSCYPTRLTAAGEAFKIQAASILAQLNCARASAGQQAPTSAETIEVAVPHTLALTFIPQWLSELEKQFGSLNCRLIAGNVHDAVLAMEEGSADLLMCYHHPQHPINLDISCYDVLQLGIERVSPYTQCNTTHKPLFTLPGTREKPVPFLAYSPHAYLRRMVDLILEHNPAQLKQHYETDMAESLKAMVLAGHGVAFLPESTVHKELNNRQLALAGDNQWSIEMDIRLYRKYRSSHPLVEKLWQHLKTIAN